MRALFALLCLLACVASAGAARAGEATEARLEYELGAEHYRQGRYTEAVQRFIASYRLVPNPNIALNIVQTFEFLKRYEDAYNWNETHLEATSGTEQTLGLERRAKLGAKVAVLVVTTQPAGAEIYIDRVELGAVGKSPLRLAVAAGERRIQTKLQRYKDASLAVEARAGTETPAHLTLAPEVGRLRVVTQPPTALVRVDPGGQSLAGPAVEVELPVGEYTLTVGARGYVARTSSVQIDQGKQSEVSVKLERAASEVSVLTVRGNVSGAVVALGGRPLGRTPLLLSDVAPGSFSLSVSAPGRQPWNGNVLLEPGGATRVSVELEPPDAGPWAGWRWLGYGSGTALLAAGGIVGVMALDAQKDFDQEPTRQKLDRIESRNLTADILLGLGVLTLGVTVTWDLLRPPSRVSSGKVEVQR